MTSILIIDDDPTICMMLQALLKRKSYEVDTSFSAKSGLVKIKAKAYDLIISDFRLPDINGLELLDQIKNKYPDIPVIIMTSYADIKTAVNAMKRGAFDYISKPLNPDEILILIKKALTGKQADSKDKKQSKHPKDKHSLKFIKGESSLSLQVDKYIKLLAPTDMSVIIEGESGTGKEIIAQRIHTEGNRRDNIFVAVDCGALTSELAGSELFGHTKGSFTGAVSDKIGQFENAKGGTIFLDEIGNLSYDIQVKLLRAIQERKIRRIGSNKDIEIDVRIVVATNEDLSLMVKDSNFREDLYHRLNEFKILVPALRDRDEDILLFANYFLELSNKELHRSIIDFSDKVKNKFLSYNWPGNLRELRNIVRRSVLLCSDNIIELNNLPDEITGYTLKLTENSLDNKNVDLKALKIENEKKMIIEALKKVNYNKSKASKLLNIDRKTLYNKIKLYGLDI